MTNRQRPPSTRRKGQRDKVSAELPKRDIRRQPKRPNSQQTPYRKDDSDPAITKSQGHGHDVNTAIYVTVRRRSRNDREAEEDRAVILRTDGVKGKVVEVSMASLPSKNYRFDRVFSSAADQRMVYEDTVLPMVDEVRMIHTASALVVYPDLKSRCYRVTTVPLSLMD